MIRNNVALDSLGSRYTVLHITSYLVPVGHQPSDMNKQAMCGDAARHEVMIQVTEDIQLLSSNLVKKKKSMTGLKITEAKFSFQVISQMYCSLLLLQYIFDMITKICLGLNLVHLRLI